MKKICFFMMLLVYAAGSKSATLTANFDSFQEGYYNKILHDGGITFSENLLYFDSGPRPANLIIEDASANALDWFPGMSSPNILVFGGGYAPGPYGSIGMFGSLKIGFEGTASSVSMDLFVSGGAEEGKNQLTLQAFSGNSLVTQRIIPIPRFDYTYRITPTISNSEFDSLRLIASGPYHYGVAFLVMDNVQITLIPEPCTVLLLGVGGLLIKRRI